MTPLTARRLATQRLAMVLLAFAPAACDAQAGAVRPASAVQAADALRRAGRPAAADSLLARAATAGVDTLPARAALAARQWRRGEHEAALRAFTGIAAAGERGAARLVSREWAAVGLAYRHLGEREPQRFKDALRAYDRAIAADSADPAPRIALARLFLSKYAGGDAATTIAGARRLAPDDAEALLVAAQVAHFEGGDSSQQLARRAIAREPGLTEARAFVAMLLLDTENVDEAAREADVALAQDSTSLEALAVVGGARLLRRDARGWAAVEARARTISTRPAELYATVAEVAARHRLYERATEVAAAGVAVDSMHWRSLAALGLNEMRVGRHDDARRTLARAFAGDPYHVWVKNTLDLLDTYGEYEEVATPHFRLMLDRSESALLGPYLATLLEEGHRALGARYGWQPPGPVRLEVFRRHADFSVRTVGLAGLGALGVSFGSTLAMDSPAARAAGEFNWGSTAWHELAHAYTLGMTEHRVPRWLSEGLSVLEERRARPGWGAGASIAFVAAFKAGQLHPASRMNEGFVRPRYPEEVILSYYQASLLCEMIEREWGTRALLAMLHGYRDGQATDAIVRRVLGLEPAALDRRFDAWVRARFATPLAAIRVATRPGPDGRPVIDAARAGGGEPTMDDLLAQLARGRALASGGQAAQAVPYLRRAIALFPELGGAESARWPLAAALERGGDLAGAAAQLDTLARLGEPPHEALLALARIRDSLGDRAAAAAALEQAIWFAPYDIATHQRLATLHEVTGAHAKAVREWQAVVALGPVDGAEALYRLALAQERAGSRADARRTVLRALEDAPNYERAQELLLRLQGGVP